MRSEAKKASDREWYLKNRERHNSNAKAYRDRNRAAYRASKTHCVDCGQKFPPTWLEFHHLEKDTKVAIVARLSGARKRLEAEIQKCVVVCKPCHRMRHSPAEMESPTPGGPS